jgi:DNA-binding NarL/FixJ family response regulator
VIPCATRKSSVAALVVAAPARECHPHHCATLSEQSRAELTDGLVLLRTALAAVQSILDNGPVGGPDLDAVLNRDQAYPLVPNVEVDQACRHALALLTPRESEVLLSIGGGMTNRRAAHVLHISEKTVKNHLSAVFSKLGAVDRTQAVVIGIRGGAIAIDEPTTSD